MISAITAVFVWLRENLGSWLGAVWGLFRRVKWFAVGLAVVAINMMDYAIEFFAWSGYTFAYQTGMLKDRVLSFLDGDGAGAWGALSDGAALMNCVLPLDYMIAAGASVMVVYLICGGIYAVVAIYKLIPFKAT